MLFRSRPQARGLVVPGASPPRVSSRSPRPQRRMAARRGDVCRDRLFLGEAVQIMRAAGLWPGPRQAAPAEGLRADDGADLVAVDIDVADLRARRDMRRDAVDARVAAARPPLARGVDRVDKRVGVAALRADARRGGTEGVER